jgi:DNA-binding HxlR family transcriptional regulator
MATVDHALRMTGALDPREAWTADPCSIAMALEVVSTRSAFLILREAFFGTTRFDDFAQRAGISEPVAAGRLRELVGEGLLEREDYREPGQRTRQRYRLTERGAELLPVLAALMQWGDRWLDESGGSVELRHRECGERVHVQLRCAGDHQVSVDDLDLASRRTRRQGRERPGAKLAQTKLDRRSTTAAQSRRNGADTA